ncbi:MAG: tetratricopeptide repeat protein [Anaerolineae bacterium]|nr:tetratricopeptide repeat protein [Anaerolineae bacterium]
MHLCVNCGAILVEGEGEPLGGEAAILLRQLSDAQEAVLRLRRYIPHIVAEGILHDQERLRGERREVAVLFADAVNFTHLSASLDAESVFNLINDLLARLVECVHRYNGVVDKFTGDGLMAVFGAPIANENDPELAVRAALDMQRAAVEFEPIAHTQLGAPLQIRIGVHSGPVISGILGTHEQAAYTVIGETVNLAARLESLSRPGHILVSNRVYQHTKPFFEFESMGTIHVKGVDQPVLVHQVVGGRAQPLPTRGVAGVKTILLGRDQELRQLHDLAPAFLADRHGRLVLIQGEAGMGKSRLVSEWLSTALAKKVTIWQGCGLPYTQGVGYRVFRSLLQDAIHSYPEGSKWDRYVSSSLRPFLHRLVGLPLSPEEEASLHYLEPERVKHLTVLAVREWILGEAQNHPLALVLEDFHWADDLSRDMLQSLVNVIHDAPVLFCIITRPHPEHALEIPDLQATRPVTTPISLSLNLAPLSPDHSRALLGQLVNLSNMPESFVKIILTRAQGNPFYIEEFVRMLIEKEVLELQDEQWHVTSTLALQSLEVPTTLRGLMMARVDRLPEDLQNILRDAAVIGLQFDVLLLEEVERRLHGTIGVSRLLERLVELGLIVRRSEAGAQFFAFRHILTQETVYNSLLRNQRPGLHSTVAECIEEIYVSRLEEQSEVLALHYDRARVRDKALHYMLLAGDRACQRFANREAIDYYSRALQLSQHLAGYEAERWQAATGLGQVEQHIGEYEEAIAIYRAALEEWKEAAPKERARVMLRIGQVWANRGNIEEAEGWLHQGINELDRIQQPHPALRAQIYSEVGWLNLRQGNLDGAQQWLEEGLQLVRDTENYDVLSSVLNRLGAVYYHHSDWKQAAECVERALELREMLGDIVGYARSLNNLGILKRTSGDSEGAIALYERAAELHERIGEVEGLALAHTNLGVQYTDLGDWEKAEQSLRKSFAITQHIGHPYEMAQAHMNLGRLYLFQERWQECEHHLDNAIPLYKESGARAHLNLNDAYDLKSRLYLEQGQLEQAVEWARQSHELLQQTTGNEQGDSIEWGRYEQLIGRIALAQNDLETASQRFEHSATIFRANGSRLSEGRTIYWKGILLAQMGQSREAEKELDTARKIFAESGAAADLQRAEKALSQLSQ